MPDAHGRFRGVSIPDVPWHRDDDRQQANHYMLRRGDGTLLHRRFESREDAERVRVGLPYPCDVIGVAVSGKIISEATPRHRRPRVTELPRG
jgi:hypothetical protein